MDIQNCLQEKRQSIENALATSLPVSQPGAEIIYQAMSYTLLAGGKRLRPTLFLLALEALGQEDTKPFLPFACALEMIHTYSLIHDDLPAMDNDDWRRGLPTCHKAFGEAQAILAGDALLTHAFNKMLQLRLVVPADNLLSAIDFVALQAGLQGMIIGQVLDITKSNMLLTLPELQEINKYKTGALFAAAVLGAAYLLGADDEKKADFTVYATHLGLAFQIVDDLLDVVGDEVKMGKSLGSDAKNAKTTYPSLLGLEVAKEEAKKEAEKAAEALKSWGPAAEPLRQIAIYLTDREY